MSFIVKESPRILAVGEIAAFGTRPIKVHDGQLVDHGDEVFVWFDETKGGRGLIGRATVRGKRENELMLQVIQLSRSSFGNAQLDALDRTNRSQLELYKKLREYAHPGVRELTPDASDILRAQFEAADTKISNEDAGREVERIRRLAEIHARGGQAEFRVAICSLYGSKCAITRCSTNEALAAAHIRIDEEHNRDFNDISNGILLRADIHALFDSGLIALAEDGRRIEVNPKLGDPSYHHLRNVHVFRPSRGAPSVQNIRHHRRRFGFA